ncbi:metallophosphoesterase family protein [Aureimonas phyllosphaerae]|uniref:Serine/threonine protein phosphatase 1 n=1 Tax=Aureimonas phyllosphaerae TaxID=1166078 RepID=A0A7W6FWA0_9HYPH|nr:metallophosphoesterase family protein [Aureimonas phyllosphaerae]MBB3938013.1 serine/threonine protein phosphatase 1 [Aureimonas phyllosphaerae]MBB3962020.1 serine/threonine protein phosphatase 1 [Aureimonas phyllosphaerae]SFF53963.1 serine/threonine protein phosphatase 1 [Aureimonas phyllosphaerae]
MGSGTVSKTLKRLLAGSSATAPQPRVERARPEIAVDPDCAYAIGDIHGCLDKLRQLEQAIVADATAIEGSKLLVYLGDYIDRGVASAAVIEHLLAPPPPGFNRVCLCGNHEEVLVDVLDGRRQIDDWLRFGGERTLLSYGYDIAYMSKHRRGGEAEALARVVEAIPKRHAAFLRQLPSAFATPSYFFAHAGIRPGLAAAEQRDDDLLWIRSPFVTDGAAGFGRLVIHGHTPQDGPVARDGRIGVDTGAYMGGPLTAVRLTADGIAFLDDR